VPGVRTGNSGSAATVIAGPANTFASSGLVLLSCYVTGTDTVRLVINNPTGGAIDPAAETWTFWVVR
jgi:hypothetical protein